MADSSKSGQEKPVRLTGYVESIILEKEREEEVVDILGQERGYVA